MSIFKKVNGEHVGTRSDGTVARISKIDFEEGEFKGRDRWISRIDGDWDGDETATFPTLREAKLVEGF